MLRDGFDILEFLQIVKSTPFLDTFQRFVELEP